MSELTLHKQFCVFDHRLKIELRSPVATFSGLAVRDMMVVMVEHVRNKQG